MATGKTLSEMKFLTQTVQPRCERLVASRAFQLTIFGVILANAVVLGLGTYGSIDAEWGDTLFLLIVFQNYNRYRLTYRQLL